jgi:tetratricopeptide (TPR) repeat protein
MRRLAALVVFLAVAAPAVGFAQQAAAPQAPLSKKERERRAESAFISGRYQEAAELLNGLFVEFHNPVYLRNLGRCHQRLKDPDRAIAAFEEYLHRAKNIPAAERDEVTGFIKEMEALKREREAAAAPPPPPPVVAAVPPPPVVTTPPPVSAPPLATAPPATVETTAAPSSGSGKLVGGLLLGAAALLAGGGGAMMATSWSDYNKGKKNCPGLFECKAIADRVEKKALIGKILFGAAAAAGIAGGTVLVLSLSRGSSSAGNGLSVALEGKF